MLVAERLLTIDQNHVVPATTQFPILKTVVEKQRVAAGNFQRLPDRFPEQRGRFSWPRGAAKQTILRFRFVKLFLARKSLVAITKNPQAVHFSLL